MVKKSASKSCAKLIQQGDVLLFRVDDIPSGAEALKPDANGRGFVLAEGEATGHCHSLTADTQAVQMFKTSDGTLYLNVMAPKAPVKHQEHKAVTLPKGKYRIGKVREVDPFADEIHAVRD